MADTADASETPEANYDWVARLTGARPEREDAVRRLHALMVRAARWQLRRMGEAAALGPARAEEVVQSSADEAAMAVLSRLADFQGRSRFTTWAYKFAILDTAAAVRREAWGRREVGLDQVPDPASAIGQPGPEAEHDDLKAALRRGIQEDLTPHQRRVLIAIALEGVPIDVIAQRTRSTRNAVYKTLHDARARLRESLAGQGYPDPGNAKEVTR